ncbi:MAG: hypothetical protein KAS71_15050, partial [Bacteroidales bacterium]|nr:hypothetical protein [Bacteroidales bacterium]
LATLGEVISLRIRTGNYIQEGFGILGRAFVWGIIGLSLKGEGLSVICPIVGLLLYFDSTLMTSSKCLICKSLLKYFCLVTINILL